MVSKQKKVTVTIISFAGLAALGVAVYLSESGYSMYDIFQSDQKNDQKRSQEESTDKDQMIEPLIDEEPTEEMPELPKPEESTKVEGATEPETPPKEPPPQPAETSNWWDYPDNIVQIQLSQVNHLTVVDKGHQLPENYIPPDLVVLSGMPGLRVKNGMQVRNIIVEPLRQLGAKAQQDGIDLVVISSYRSFQTQQSTYNYWVSYNGGNTDIADQISARPGHSEHQLGTVVDFSSNEIGDAIGAQFNNTKASKWLADNAPSYGFRLSYPPGQEESTGFAHESWHWRWWGN